jgi:hypothetical protein
MLTTQRHLVSRLPLLPHGVVFNSILEGRYAVYSPVEWPQLPRLVFAMARIVYKLEDSQWLEEACLLAQYGKFTENFTVICRQIHRRRLRR